MTRHFPPIYHPPPRFALGTLFGAPDLARTRPKSSPFITSELIITSLAVKLAVFEFKAVDGVNVFGRAGLGLAGADDGPWIPVGSSIGASAA